MNPTWVERITQGHIPSAARLISEIERGNPAINPLLQQLFLAGGSSLLLGITGPPGAGKSSLVNQMIGAYRQQGKRIAVLAVDPSSPFSGGAILGDRVRMNQHASDPHVFIRSMAARGQLGGLAKAAGDAVTVLDAMNFDVIIIETVGVGQSEIDILRHAQCVLLLQTPDSGDRIQAVKAGVLEIGDIYIVNKADHDGATTVKNAITEMLHMQPARHNNQWQPPVLLTQANNNSATSNGVNELLAGIEQYQKHRLAEPQQAQNRDQQQLRHRILDICQQLAQQQLFSNTSERALLEQELEAITLRQSDPYSLARRIIGDPLETPM